jgi:signal peptidase I
MVEMAPGDPEGSTSPAERKSVLRRAVRFLGYLLREIVMTVVPAILIALFVNVVVAQATVVDGPSMTPNLYSPHRVVVEKLTYRFAHGPRRGDVVVFEMPGDAKSLIKRVIALPGEMVEVRDGNIYIDGQLYEENWLTQHDGSDYPATSVPPLHIFVMGDNRAYSRDSRSFGPVPTERVVGRAWLIYWPLGDLGFVD